MYGSRTTFAHCCIIILLALYNRVRKGFSLFLFYILSNKSEIYFVKAFILLKTYKYILNIFVCYILKV